MCCDGVGVDSGGADVDATAGRLEATTEGDNTLLVPGGDELMIAITSIIMGRGVEEEKAFTILAMRACLPSFLLFN